MEKDACENCSGMQMAQECISEEEKHYDEGEKHSISSYHNEASFKQRFERNSSSLLSPRSD